MNATDSAKTVYAAVEEQDTIRMELPIAELLMRARELIRYLRRYGEITWADWLEDRMESLRRDSRAGLPALLEGFEGMGGITGIYLCPEAGHRLQPRHESAINEKLLKLVSAVYQLTRELGDFIAFDHVPRAGSATQEIPGG